MIKPTRSLTFESHECSKRPKDERRPSDPPLPTNIQPFRLQQPNTAHLVYVKRPLQPALSSSSLNTLNPLESTVPSSLEQGECLTKKSKRRTYAGLSPVSKMPPKPAVPPRSSVAPTTTGMRKTTASPRITFAAYKPLTAPATSATGKLSAAGATCRTLPPTSKVPHIPPVLKVASQKGGGTMDAKGTVYRSTPRIYMKPPDARQSHDTFACVFLTILILGVVVFAAFAIMHPGMVRNVFALKVSNFTPPSHDHTENEYLLK
ncbi:uncharacterized protein LOC135396197 [Ornithodoros turicata]|uniref:uncharacterized protein LOC135396197 n=1 Tax=Ornithodoros turicata TaxID=34597 RepID=UPI0031394199